jgi:hypothetical protein
MKDVGYGLVIPVLVGLLVVAFPAIFRPALDAAFPPPNMITGAAGSSLAVLTTILTHGFALILVFAIPVVLGLVWNRWAGGAAGFLMGTLYYVAFAGYTITSNMLTFAQIDPASAFAYSKNLYADPSFIGDYIVGGVLIGYIAGALCNGSSNFKRMLGAGLTAALTVGILTFVFNYTVSYGAWMTQADPLYALFTTMLPLIILGIIAPIISKVMTWYGLQPVRH